MQNKTQIEEKITFELSDKEANIIIEALKMKDINNIDKNNLITLSGHDTLIKFRQFY